jgi:hypothetical protein
LVSSEGRGQRDIREELFYLGSIAKVRVSGLPPVLPLFAVVGQYVTRGRGVALLGGDRFGARGHVAPQKLKGLAV